MPNRSRDEVLAYAEGVCKLVRARKHLENRGAERACIRLLENVINRAEREFFEPTIFAFPTGAPTAVSIERSKLVPSIRLPSEPKKLKRGKPVNQPPS
jgi:hypothetical protein